MVPLPMTLISARKVISFAACVGIGVILYTTTMMVKLSLERKVYHGLISKHQFATLPFTTQTMYSASVNEHNFDINERKFSIAIGLAITSKYSRKESMHSFLDNLPFFEELLPSFCMTVGQSQHSYHFYLGHDEGDQIFNNQTIQRLCKEEFFVFTQKHCPNDLKVSIQFVHCNHSGRPAWAQNDAMMAAHQDGHEFFYRVNDDTIMITRHWANIFISKLKQMKPPFVGVVGPKHAGGNIGILTYDFVHRTHVDIFGYYYPREFAWWYADTWITNVYKPRWSVKVNEIRVLHTQSLKRRYKLHTLLPTAVSAVVNRTYLQLERYLGISPITVNNSTAAVMKKGNSIS